MNTTTGTTVAPQRPRARARAAHPADVELSGPTPQRPLDHTWVVAATVRVSRVHARNAFRVGWFRTVAGTRVDALDVYCQVCRRTYEDCADQPCAAQVDNRHLIGGDQAVRAKRIRHAPPPGAVAVAPPAIDRRGADQ